MEAKLHGTCILKLHTNCRLHAPGEVFDIDMDSANQYMAKFIGSIKSLFVIKEPQLIFFFTVKNLGRLLYYLEKTNSSLLNNHYSYAVNSNASNVQCLMKATITYIFSVSASNYRFTNASFPILSISLSTKHHNIRRYALHSDMLTELVNKS